MEEFSSEKQVNGQDTILDAGAKLTVQPLHDVQSVQGEQTSAEIANAHANGPAIANFEGDIESTSAEPQRMADTQTVNQRAAELMELHKASMPTKKSLRLPLSIAAVVIMLGLLLFFLLYR